MWEGFKKLKQKRCREKEELKFRERKHIEKMDMEQQWWTCPSSPFEGGWLASRILEETVRVTGFTSHD